jgi:hypothetical protein
MTQREEPEISAPWLLVCVTDQQPRFEARLATRPNVVAILDDLHLVGLPLEDAHAASRPSRPQLEKYQRVVELCFEQSTTVPLRFGSMVANKARALEVLQDGQAGFRAAVALARGCVEMGVRVEATERPPETTIRRPTEASSGAQYLAARSAQLETNTPRVPAALKNILRDTCKAANATRSEFPVGDFDGPSVCYNFLVRCQHLDAFRRKIDAWAPVSRRIAVSGPWPPFSFTGPKP